MEPNHEIAYQWKLPSTQLPYSTGVSLHSHTSHSVESLTFIHNMFLEVPTLRKLFAHYEKKADSASRITLDFVSAYWSPPLRPRVAFDLESKQITDLGLKALVSITDHDDIQAPLLLRTIPSARAIPVSLEWTVNWGKTSFHLGVHNLPSAEASAWMQRLADCTEKGTEETVGAILADLHSNPQILVILNHPLWDLYKIGNAAHNAELDRFLRLHNRHMHALELNGLRHARENQQVVALAKQWSQLLISGGDRHGLEPNANINLTNATSFTEFVHEIRQQRISRVLFMNQYRNAWQDRILGSTIDAVLDHPQFSPGWQRWDERAFHKDAQGVIRPLAELWPEGKAPLVLRLSVGVIRLAKHRPCARAIRMMLPRVEVDALNVAQNEIA